MISYIVLVDGHLVIGDHLIDRISLLIILVDGISPFIYYFDGCNFSRYILVGGIFPVIYYLVMDFPLFNIWWIV